MSELPKMTKMSDLPNFKQLEARALEVGRMLSESKELCEAMAAWHQRHLQRHQERASGKLEVESTFSSELLARLVNDPFHLSRKFTDI
jgi:hypothetical protein